MPNDIYMPPSQLLLVCVVQCHSLSFQEPPLILHDNFGVVSSLLPLPPLPNPLGDSLVSHLNCQLLNPLLLTVGQPLLLPFHHGLQSGNVGSLDSLCR